MVKLIQTSYIKHLPSYALITEFSKSHEEIESITYISLLVFGAKLDKGLFLYYVRVF